MEQPRIIMFNSNNEDVSRRYHAGVQKDIGRRWAKSKDTHDGNGRLREERMADEPPHEPFARTQARRKRAPAPSVPRVVGCVLRHAEGPPTWALGLLPECFSGRNETRTAKEVRLGLVLAVAVRVV